MGRGLGPPWGGGARERRGAAARAGSTSRAPRRFAPSGQGLPAPGPARRARPRPRLRAPWLPRGGGAAAVRPGRAPSTAAGRLQPAATPPPPGPALPVRGSAGRRRWRGPRPGLGLGAGGAGPGEAPREGHRSGGGAQRGGCGEPRRAAPLPPGALAGLFAAASETRRLPRAPGARSWAAAAAAAGSPAPLAGACARSPPPAPGQAGAASRGPAGDGQTLGSGLRLATPPRAQIAGLPQQLQ